MESFSSLLATYTGNPHKGQWRGALVFSLICAWINRWVNIEAGNLRRYHANRDVIVLDNFIIEILGRVGRHVTEHQGTPAKTSTKPSASKQPHWKIY